MRKRQRQDPNLCLLMPKPVHFLKKVGMGLGKRESPVKRKTPSSHGSWLTFIYFALHKHLLFKSILQVDISLGLN